MASTCLEAIIANLLPSSLLFPNTPRQLSCSLFFYFGEHWEMWGLSSSSCFTFKIFRSIPETMLIIASYRVIRAIAQIHYTMQLGATNGSSTSGPGLKHKVSDWATKGKRKSVPCCRSHDRSTLGVHHLSNSRPYAHAQHRYHYSANISLSHMWGTRLIAEDMGCSNRSAFNLMHESG